MASHSTRAASSEDAPPGFCCTAIRKKILRQKRSNKVRAILPTSLVGILPSSIASRKARLSIASRAKPNRVQLIEYAPTSSLETAWAAVPSSPGACFQKFATHCRNSFSRTSEGRAQ
jgi:hypothetical protein